MPTPRTLEQLATLEPHVRALGLELVTRAEARGLRVTVTEGRRTYARQAELYAANPMGAARPGTSKHETGLAFDVAFLRPDGSWSYDEREQWEELGRIGEELGLTWGGRWRSGRWAGTKGDRPHFEGPPASPPLLAGVGALLVLLVVGAALASR